MSLKNRIRAELLRRGVQRPDNFVRSFSIGSNDWMRSLGIPTISSCLDCPENFQEQIEYINTQLLDEHNRRQDAQLIATIRGIGLYSALLILAKIDDIRRFPHPENLCAYARLMPTVRQSASSVRYDAISKSGSSYFGWMLTEAVHTQTRCKLDSRLSRLYAKAAKRRRKQKAIVATARKLLLVIYWVLRTKEPYRCQRFNPVFPSARTSVTSGLGQVPDNGQSCHSSGKKRTEACPTIHSDRRRDANLEENEERFRRR
jgi:transposase